MIDLKKIKSFGSLFFGGALITLILMLHTDTAIYSFISKHTGISHADPLAKLSENIENPNQFLAYSEAEIDEYVSAALRADPTSSSPFVGKGMERLSKSDFDTAETFLKFAQARNPRDDYAAVYLFFLYSSQGKFLLALEQIDILFGINPSKSQLYADLVSNLSSQPGGNAVIYQSLRNKPNWSKRFILNEIKYLRGPKEVVELVVFWSQFDDEEKSSFALHKQLAAKLKKNGDFASLRRLKENISGSENNKASVIYNNDFSPGSISGTLGWSYVPSSRTYAEPKRQGGLDVGYTGQKEKVLASQMFWLPSIGDYKLDIKLHSDFNFESPLFFTEISCLKPEMKILDLDITSLQRNLNNTDKKNLPSISGDPLFLSGTFQSSESCEAYILKLIARPNEFARGARVHFESIAVNYIRNEK